MFEEMNQKISFLFKQPQPIFEQVNQKISFLLNEHKSLEDKIQRIQQSQQSQQIQTQSIQAYSQPALEEIKQKISFLSNEHKSLDNKIQSIQLQTSKIRKTVERIIPANHSPDAQYLPIIKITGKGAFVLNIDVVTNNPATDVCRYLINLNNQTSRCSIISSSIPGMVDYSLSGDSITLSIIELESELKMVMDVELFSTSSVLQKLKISEI